MAECSSQCPQIFHPSLFCPEKRMSCRISRKIRPSDDRAPVVHPEGITEGASQTPKIEHVAVLPHKRMNRWIHSDLVEVEIHVALSRDLSPAVDVGGDAVRST